MKVENARAMGANVILWDRDYFKRWEKVDAEVKAHGYIKVHPYEEPMVMAGQGTIALEILEDLPDIDAVLVPIGGGGLISGVATAFKALKPSVRIVGVQPAASPAYYNSRLEGRRVSVSPLSTVADGLSCRQAGENPYIMIEKYVDEIVTVEEGEILEAVRLIADKVKLIAEPSACVAPAALMYKKTAVSTTDKVACVLTAGNWNIEDLGRIYVGDTPKTVH